MHTHCKRISEFSLFLHHSWFTTGDVLVSVLWAGRDRYPECQLSAGNPSFRRESWRDDILLSKEGLGAMLEEGVTDQVFDGESESVVLRSFLLL